jgi:hypothetical protein
VKVSSLQGINFLPAKNRALHPDTDYTVRELTPTNVFENPPHHLAWAGITSFGCHIFFSGGLEIPNNQYSYLSDEDLQEGAHQQGVPSNVLMHLSLRTISWSELQPMNSFRYHHALVCDGEEYLYAIGGVGGTIKDQVQVLTSVERYSLYGNRWENVAPLKDIHKDEDSQNAVSACIHDGVIYVLGGHFILQKYHVAENVWQVLAQFSPQEVDNRLLQTKPQPTLEPCLVYFEGKLFCFGSVTFCFELSSSSLLPIPSKMTRKGISMATAMNGRLIMGYSHDVPSVCSKRFIEEVDFKFTTKRRSSVLCMEKYKLRPWHMRAIVPVFVSKMAMNYVYDS